MLLLVSERQGMQKGTFLQQLLPRELHDYYTDDFSLSSKGNAQRKIVEFAIINIGLRGDRNRCCPPSGG